MFTYELWSGCNEMETLKPIIGNGFRVATETNQYPRLTNGWEQIECFKPVHVGWEILANQIAGCCDQISSIQLTCNNVDLSSPLLLSDLKSGCSPQADGGHALD
ncbi:hypothetical protein YC2023_074674 [Brassica napus]